MNQLHNRQVLPPRLQHQSRRPKEPWRQLIRRLLPLLSIPLLFLLLSQHSPLCQM